MKTYEHILKETKDLIPYINNSRTHNDKQVNQIVASIKEFGFTNPVLIDENDTVIAGHGRLLACSKLNIQQVPCIVLEGLTEAQKKAYVIADNKLAENAGWDEEMLAIELQSLQEMNYDLDVIGFETDELAEWLGKEEQQEGTGEDNPYTMSIDAPTYEPKNEQPLISDLTVHDKTDDLIKAIEHSNCSDDEKKFLIQSAERHRQFDFQKIADYYAHASIEMQNLMEQSALVIIDYKSAYENGFIKIKNDMQEHYDDERP